MTRVLFVCSANRDRSPTAEQVFASWPDIETDSAGTRPDADVRISVEHIAWADIIFVMEGRHRKAIAATFEREIKDKRIVCLYIPDNYVFMAPDLITVLERKIERHLAS